MQLYVVLFAMVFPKDAKCMVSMKAIKVMLYYWKSCNPICSFVLYQGLVDGGKCIRKMDWKSVRGFLGVVSCIIQVG